MVGHRFLEMLGRARAPGGAPSTSRCSARSRGSPTIASACRSSSPARRRDLSLVAPGQYEAAGFDAPARRRARGASIASAASSTRRRRRESPYDTLRARDRLVSVRAAGPGRDRPAASSTARSRTSRRSAPAAAHASDVGAVIGGGLLGLEAAKALRDLGLETHVVEFAPRLMARAGRRRAAARVLRTQHRGAGRRGAHRRRDHREIVDGDGARARACAFADGSRAGRRHGRVLRRHPPARRAGARRRPRRRRARRHRRSTTRCRTSDPDIYAIGECALVRTAASTAWSRPATRWRDVAARRSAAASDAAFTGADMSTKLKLMGVDVASFGDALRRARRARTAISFIDERSAGLQEARRVAPTASTCSAACWSATPPTTARCCRWR